MHDTAPTPKKRSASWLVWLLLVSLAVMLFWLFGRGTQNAVLEEPAVPIVDEPVVYDVAAWQSQTPLKSPFKEPQALLAKLGATARKSDSLDVAGNQAQVYHYHHQTEPPLYVMDSEKFFEIAWYYASSKDNQKDKATAQHYASRAYLLASAITDKPKPVFEKILAQKSPTLPTGIVLAQCKNYLCQVVFEKDKF